MKARLLSLVLLLLLTSPAYALIPASGLWWNPTISGSGFEIDLQGQTMALTAYDYDHGGAPLWYLAAGDYDDTTQTFTGDANTFAGGQCLGCGYTSPVAMPAGLFSVTFTDAEHATVSFPGGSYPIEHFAYGYASKLDYLLGEWVFTTIDVARGYPPGGAEWIIFDTHADNGVDGSPSLNGHGDGYEAYAIAQYDSTSNSFLVLIVDGPGTIESPGHQTSYMISGDDRRMTGEILDADPGDPMQAAAFRLSY